jgi:hypothetical protein
MHERQAIRDAIVARLIAANTSAANRVKKTQLAPQPEALLPAITISSQDEETDPASRTSSPRELKRRHTVEIVGWAAVEPNGAIDDALDALALEIETAMDGDVWLANTAFDSVLTTTELGLSLDGRRPMGAVRLTYEVTYHTDIRSPGPTNNFALASTTFKVPAVDPDGTAVTQPAADRASDLTELETE